MMAEPDKTHPDYWVRVRMAEENFNSMAERMKGWKE